MDSLVLNSAELNQLRSQIIQERKRRYEVEEKLKKLIVAIQRAGVNVPSFFGVNQLNSTSNRFPPPGTGVGQSDDEDYLQYLGDSVSQFFFCLEIFFIVGVFLIVGLE